VSCANSIKIRREALEDLVGVLGPDERLRVVTERTGRGGVVGERIQVSARVTERIRRDFPDPELATLVIDLLEKWGNAWPQGEVDRVQAAIALRAAGDMEKVLALVELAYSDYRDVLMATGFAHADWAERMEAAFQAK
jgi:hypothetical protein